MGTLRGQEAGPFAHRTRAETWHGPRGATLRHGLLCTNPVNTPKQNSSGGICPKAHRQECEGCWVPQQHKLWDWSPSHLVPSPKVHRARGAHPSPGCPLSLGLGLVEVFVLRLPCLSSLWKMGANHPTTASEPPSHPGKPACVRARTCAREAAGPWRPGWVAREGVSQASRPRPLPRARRISEQFVMTKHHISLYLWARLSWFRAVNPGAASAKWARLLEDQECP